MTIRTERIAGGVLLIATAVCSLPLLAAPKYDYGVVAEFGIGYTDNLFLSRDGQEMDDLVFLVEPGFYFTADSDRLQGIVKYQPQAIFYSDNNNFDDIYHTLDGTLNMTLLPKRAFLELGAYRFQSIVSPEGTITTNNIAVSNNRTDSTVLVVRPSWEQELGFGDVFLEVGYINSSFDDSRGEDSEQKHIAFSLGNADRQQGLAWGVNYEYRRLEYDTAAPWDFEMASATLGYWVNGNLRLFTSTGFETPSNRSDLSGDAESMWEVGFEYVPNQRMNLEIAVGDRSFGAFSRGAFTYRLKRGNLSITYSENQNARGAQGFDRRPLTDTDGLDGILDRAGFSDSYIRKRGELAVSSRLARTDITARVFHERRVERFDERGIALEDEQLSGVALRLSWTPGAKTTFALAADLANRQFEGRDDDLNRFSANVTYDLSRRISLGLELSHSEQIASSTDPDDEYRENRALIYVRTEF